MIGRDAPRVNRVRVPAGPHAVGVSVVRQANARGVDDLFSEWGISSGVGSLTIVGPSNATGPGETPSRRKIFVCRPGRPEEETPCARRTLAALATRAYRRPVPERDPSIDILMGFYTSGRERRGFDTGIQYALARVLVDPRFIFRFEREPASLRPAPSTGSTTSSWRRVSRSSCGAACRTKSCWPRRRPER